MKYNYIFLFTLLSFTLFSCDEEEIIKGDMEIKIDSEELTLTNTTSEKLYYFVIERNAQAYIDWIPTVGEGGLEKNEKVELKIEDIHGMSSEDRSDEIIVYYWGEVEENGELVPGNLVSESVEIP